MNKKIRDMKMKIAAKVAEAKGFLDGENKDVEKATAILDEVESLKKELAALERAFALEEKEAKSKAEKQLGEKKEQDVTEKFASVIRGMVRKDGTVTPMTEGVNANGGYTVPQDIQTEIRHFKEAEFSFEKYISKETVTTNSGRRTFQAKATCTGFTEVNEAGATPAIAAPTYTPISYTITDKAGFIPLTKDLINDSSANLRAEIVRWFGRQRTATINNKVLNKLTNGVTPTAITDLKGLKKLVNVTLGSAYDCKIFTNDDGLNWLDSLEDTQHRPLLTPVPNEQGKMQLCIGGKIREVVPVPNSVWASASGANSSTVIPFIVGELSEAIKMFDRQALEIAVSDTAAVTGFNAFEQNGVLMKGVLRNDFVKQDADAYKYATVTVTA
nr:phage major capsid protein [uncultured Ruminococcus sp.]